jgi:Dipeptidyl peptidase IV (DPP IV) N-terminal region
MNLHNN